MKKLFALFLIFFLLVTPLAVSADSTATDGGVVVTVETDKIDYNADETVNVTVTVTNNGDKDITDIKVNTALPDNISADETSFDLSKLTPGESKDFVTVGTVISPTVSITPTQSDTADDSSKSIIVLIIISAAVLVACLIFILIKYRKSAKIMMLFPLFAIALGLIPFTASANSTVHTLSADKEITVNGESCTVKADVTYNVSKYSSQEVNARVEDLLSTKHKLTYNEDGSFRVLILADAHMDIGGNATDVQEIKDRIKLLVDHENPDLVIFTGDNTIGAYSEESLRACIDAITGYIEEKQIPWCHVFGNHDEECGLPKEIQQAVYESYEYCISKSGPEDIFGIGNYVLGIYNTDGSLGSVIYCLDSGAYYSGGGYDYIKDDQVYWYQETSELLQAYNGGNLVPALAAFHIPLYENRLAYDNRDNKEIVSEWDGERNENICSSDFDKSIMFEMILARGDIKACVTGHDHINDYMFNYYGVKLCNSPNISDMIYHDHRMQGARVFDMNLSTIDNIPTHVTRLMSLYDPSEAVSYDTLADNVVFEFSKDTVDSTAVYNWNGGGLSGSATVTLTDNNCIEVTRSNEQNMEFVLEIDNKGTLGGNKYLAVWADFTNVEFRKACFGLNTDNHYYRTDDADFTTPFYYIPDGATDVGDMQTLYHGLDGCFGNAQSCDVQGMKGYFIFPVEYFRNGPQKLTSESAIIGVYFYASLKNDPQYFNQPFYFDNIRLVTEINELFN